MRSDYSFFEFFPKNSLITKGLSVFYLGLFSIGLVQLNAQVSPDAMGDMERIKRMEANLLLTNAISEADKLVKAGDFAKARKRYEDVMAKTSADGPNKNIYNTARTRLSGLLAYQASQTRDGAKSRALLEEALSIDPDNANLQAQVKTAQETNKTVRETFPENSVADQDLLERVTRIQQLIYEGDSFTRTGQYERAVGKFDEILIIDPYNKVAYKRKERVEKLKMRAATLRRNAFRVRAMADVEQAWVNKPKARTAQKPAASTDDFEVSRINQMFDKLENIRIPVLNFTDVDVSDAVSYLQQQSRVLDPDKEGVNFVLKADQTVIPSGDEQKEGDATQATDSSVLRTLTLDLRDMPLIKVLDFISSLTNLKYKVEEYAVYLFPANETSEVLVIRSFTVPPNFFSSRVVSRDARTAIGTNEVQIEGADVKKELQDKGVNFPSGSSAAYLPKTSRLVIRNTLDQINLIEQLVFKEIGETTQIEIETKLVEYIDDGMKDFSFNWRVNSDAALPPALASDINNAATFVPPNNLDADGDGFPDFQTSNGDGSSTRAEVGFGSNLRGSPNLSPNRIDALLNLGINRNPAQLGFSAVVNNSGVSVLLSALESNFGGDLVTAPKITLVNGQKSKIRVVREFLYPTEYEAPELESSQVEVGGTSVTFTSVTPANPSEFESRDVGVTLEVKANATPDRRIDLELTPEVIEFEGFINYGGDATSLNNSTQVDTDGDGVPDTRTFAVPVDQATRENSLVTLAEGVALTPVFSNRSVKTKLQVIDGQTVIMGGFIRSDEQEIEDKIPVLGDLPLIGRVFRSKASQTIKRNLVMFVTARMVKPDGTPKFLTEDEAEALEVSQVGNN